ncbi:hypothetical protein MCERE19_00318 [Spirosomataceae bacterium]
MPVYLNVFNLIINKTAIYEKYVGGVEQFRIDYGIPLSKINHEDDELFSLGQMNADEFDIDSLKSKGLSFDNDKYESDDFTIVSRYGELSWDAKWLKYNRLFAWHIDTSPDLISKMEGICKMRVADIMTEMENGNNVFKTIRLMPL